MVCFLTPSSLQNCRRPGAGAKSQLFVHPRASIRMGAAANDNAERRGNRGPAKAALAALLLGLPSVQGGSRFSRAGCDWNGGCLAIGLLSAPLFCVSVSTVTEI